MQRGPPAAPKAHLPAALGPFCPRAPVAIRSVAHLVCLCVNLLQHSAWISCASAGWGGPGTMPGTNDQWQGLSGPVAPAGQPGSIPRVKWIRAEWWRSVCSLSVNTAKLALRTFFKTYLNYEFHLILFYVSKLPVIF